MALLRPFIQRLRKRSGLAVHRWVRRVRSRLGKPNRSMATSITRVYSSRAFGNVFPRGSRVVELHFFPTDPKSMIRSLRSAMDNFPSWKSAGFAGVYGDTPTPELQRFWAKSGAVIIDCPPADAAIARKHYAYGVAHFGFPPMYLDAPIKRVMVPFQSSMS